MRRRTLNLVLGLGLIAPVAGMLPLPALAEGVDMEVATAPRILGNPDAKLLITEYFSMTCPHCARFHNEVLPKLKEAYIDTGKIRFEFKDFPLDQWALRASAMARCLDGKRYFAMVEILMKKQEAWSRANDPYGALVKLGKLAGLSEAQIDACMNDEKLIDYILNERLTASRDLGITATPSFMMNGRKLDGVFTFESFEEAISAAL
ncbi:MAG: DsbA family protein [Nisaea sp.]|uniref:DsbA family protein n=1 Tax=Nisaea sp. TaxID=2024842 RepID=UPI001B1FEA66|nr:DsbA family protein [Nisaea sp.]MBO6559317.1 DsbA family protein [Nisaea sp.]